MTLVVATVLLVASMHVALTASPAAPQIHPAGPTHTSHPMAPVPPPPGAPGVTESTAAKSICPLAASQCLSSFNWGGYAVCVPQPACAAAISGTGSPAPGAVTDVQGTWVVPTISGSGGRLGSSGTQCSDSENTWYDMSDWVGIDGFVSPTVEQTGTSSDCYYGQAYYYAWYEFYPAGSVLVSSVTVHPGDTMTAEVSYSGGMFTTTITDETTHQTFTSDPTAVAGAQTNSAEWIAESAYFDGFLALTQTSLVHFSDATATIGGVTQSISDWGSSVYWLLMVDYNFGFNQETGVATPSTMTLAYAKAYPSVVGKSDDGFYVVWLSSGP
jgi:hypothetical protein